jgi:hypothetical protein
MADIYLDWNSFGAGLVVGLVGAWFVCDLVFPTIKKD